MSVDPRFSGTFRTWLLAGLLPSGPQGRQSSGLTACRIHQKVKETEFIDYIQLGNPVRLVPDEPERSLLPVPSRLHLDESSLLARSLCP